MGYLYTGQRNANLDSFLTNEVNSGGWQRPYVNSTAIYAGTIETWLYVSANQIKVAGNRVSQYISGLRIRFQQGDGFVYFYVLSSSFGAGVTTINLTAGDDYEVTNDPITDNWLSGYDRPRDFPAVFSYTPTFGTAVGTFTIDTIYYADFSYIGGIVFIYIYYFGTQNTSNSQYLTFSLPIKSAGLGNDQLIPCFVENGAAAPIGFFNVFNNSTECDVYRSAEALWTPGTGRYVIGNFSYVGH